MSDATTPEQLRFNIDEEEYLRLEKIHRELGRTGAMATLDDLQQRIEADRFSFADIVNFAAEQGQPVQIAGKSFKRYYNGLSYLEALPPIAGSESQRLLDKRERRLYEKIRDGSSHKLGLLAAVLARPDLADDDYYTRLLREFHDSRVANLLVKPSTSA